MITPKQATEMGPDHTLYDACEARVDEAIRRAAEVGRWPCTVAIAGTNPAVLRTLVVNYAAAGWSIRVVRDQRDGDFLQLEQP